MLLVDRANSVLRNSIGLLVRLDPAVEYLAFPQSAW